MFDHERLIRSNYVVTYTLFSPLCLLLFTFIAFILWTAKKSGFILYLIIILLVADLSFLTAGYYYNMTCNYFFGFENPTNFREFKKEFDVVSGNLTNYEHKWACCQGLAQSLNDVVHWTFVLKYWSLSFKIQLMLS